MSSLCYKLFLFSCFDQIKRGVEFRHLFRYCDILDLEGELRNNSVLALVSPLIFLFIKREYKKYTFSNFKIVVHTCKVLNVMIKEFRFLSGNVRFQPFCN